MLSEAKHLWLLGSVACEMIEILHFAQNDKTAFADSYRELFGALILTP